MSHWASFPLKPFLTSSHRQAPLAPFHPSPCHCPSGGHVLLCNDVCLHVLCQAVPWAWCVLSLWCHWLGLRRAEGDLGPGWVLEP